MTRSVEAAAQRRKLLGKIQRLAEIAIFGTLSETYRTCGRTGCHCQGDGPKHGPHLNVSFRGEKGKTTGYYVPKGAEKATRLTLLPPEAHIQMGTMLGSISLTVAARSSAGAVGFRQRSENGDLGQTLNLAQQLASLGGGINRPGHGVSCALDSERWKID